MKNVEYNKEFKSRTCKLRCSAGNKIYEYILAISMYV